MRLGVLADVHGNLPALEAAIGVLEEAGAQRFLCLGDLVGFGAQPDECVARVAALEPLAVVAGNHDLIATGALSDARCSRAARESLRWTRGRLGADARTWLAALPLEARPVPGLLLTHGGLGDPERYVARAEQAAAELARLEDARLLLVGHTHVPLAVAQRAGVLLHGRAGRVTLPPEERALLNPGAVGQSRQRSPAARALLLDPEAGLAAFHAFGYDRGAARRALRAAGQPAGALHRRPYAPRALVRRGRRLAGRARRAARS